MFPQVFVCSQGAGCLPLPRMHHWSHDQGGYGWVSGQRGVFGQGDGCLGRGGGGGRPPPEMATAAVGTYPTGMHSC